jgi:hypothetical protein
MSLDLHEILVPTYLHGFDRLTHFLRKARDYADEKGIAHAELVGARLIDDMFPLSAQVQRASDTAKLSGERLSGQTAPGMPDTEQTFDELHARIGATMAYLRSIDPQALNSAASRTVTLTFGKTRVEFGGADYVLQFALPNFHFHIVTAYAILRQKGVPLGKLDYLGQIGTPVA